MCVNYKSKKCSFVSSFFFIYVRLFIDARIAINRDPRWGIRDFIEYPPDSSERRAAFTECGEVVKVYGEALKSFVNEIRGELEFYPKYWKDLLPCNQHALIVVSRINLHQIIIIHVSICYI